VTEARERPILFSGPMVRKIIDGHKTQTRRVARLTHGGHVKEPSGHRRWHPDDPDAVAACPYGQPGDRLWVREAWCAGPEFDDTPPRDIPEGAPIWYLVDGERPVSEFDEAPIWGRSRPSIHMPRWASRLSLEVTGVRVERLQEIGETDARSEGCKPVLLGDRPGHLGRERSYRTSVGVFQDLWDSINDKRGAGWASNPWVWVVTFKKIEATP